MIIVVNPTLYESIKNILEFIVGINISNLSNKTWVSLLPLRSVYAVGSKKKDVSSIGIIIIPINLIASLVNVFILIFFSYLM